MCCESLSNKYENPAAARLARLREAMAREGMQAFYVRGTSNIRWLTAFDGVFDSEEAHALLVTPASAQLHTDTRYSEAARAAAAEMPAAGDGFEKGESATVPSVATDSCTCDASASAESAIPSSRVPLVTVSDERKTHARFVADALAELRASRPVEDVGALGIEDSLTLADFRALEAALAEVRPQLQPRLQETAGFVCGLRAVKDAGEIARMRAAQALTDAAFSHIVGFMRPGMTEREVQVELEDFMVRHGAEGLAFSSIVATGANGASPHAIAGPTVLEAGQCVVLDFGAKAQGYCSDMTRTVFLGAPSECMRAAYEAIRAANEQVEALLKPGVTGKQAHELAEQVLAEAGFAGRMGHGLGHGVGLDIHEEPTLSTRNEAPLVAGNVVTVEPGIYLPGEFGMRLEDFGVITETGFEAFTRSTHDMVVL